MKNIENNFRCVNDIACVLLLGRCSRTLAVHIICETCAYIVIRLVTLNEYKKKNVKYAL